MIDSKPFSFAKAIVLVTIFMLQLTSPSFSQTSNQNTIAEPVYTKDSMPADLDYSNDPDREDLAYIERIEKERKHLLDAVINDDSLGIRYQYNQLIKLGNDHYLAMYPIEQWLLGYYFEEYEHVGDMLKIFQAKIAPSIPRMVKPEEDYLTQKLVELSVYHKYRITYDLQLSELPDEERDFHLLFLDYILSDIDDPTVQARLNEGSDEFLKNYYQSDYESLIRTYIRRVIVPSDFGYGMDFSAGVALMSGALKENFSTMGLFGFGFDGDYKRFVMYLRMHFIFGHLLKDMDFNGTTWRKDARTVGGNFEASFGYNLFENHRFKLVPFGGISTTGIDPTSNDIEKYPEYENVGITFCTTFQLGLNLDLKLGSPKERWNPYFHKTMRSYGLLRFRYTFAAPQFQWKVSGLDGHIHYLTLGYGGFLRGLKRDY